MKTGGDFAQCLDIGTPIVDEESIMRYGAEHARKAGRGAWVNACRVRGNTLLRSVAVVLIGQLSKGAGLGMEPRHVWRHREQHGCAAPGYPGPPSAVRPSPPENLTIDVANCTKQAHAVRSRQQGKIPARDGVCKPRLKAGLWLRQIRVRSAAKIRGVHLDS